MAASSSASSQHIHRAAAAQQEYPDTDDSLKLLSQDTYAHLFDTLKQESGGE